MAKDILIIGAGGVGAVVAHKCAQLAAEQGIFGKIILASRTLSKCENIVSAVKQRFAQVEIFAEQVDADNVAESVVLLQKHQPFLLLNLALPYQDLALMEACLQSGVHYLDTANYEPPETAHFEYSWQWNLQEKFITQKLMALLGAGFDPGVTNVFCKLALEEHFSQIEQVDIIDCNAGDHGRAFATNFNPEINIREVTAPCRHFENGKWLETPAIGNAFNKITQIHG